MIAHLLLAFGVQFLVGRLTGRWWGGAAAAWTWAISREITQAEYRWIEQFGNGRRANMPWWGGLDLRVWQSLDPWLDWLVPCAVTLLVALVIGSRAASASVTPEVPRR